MHFSGHMELVIYELYHDIMPVNFWHDWTVQKVFQVYAKMEDLEYQIIWSQSKKAPAIIMICAVKFKDMLPPKTLL